MNKMRCIVAAAALLASGTVAAGAPWTFVDLGYVVGDSGDERSMGVALRGSFGFAEIWHVGLGVSSFEDNGGKDEPAGSDDNGVDIFVGLHPALTSNTDLVLELGYTSVEVDDGSTKDDINGIYLRAGPRAMLGEKFEIKGYLVNTFGQDKTQTGQPDFTSVGLLVGGAYYFTPSISLGADADLTDSEDIVNIYVRWSFN
jgi:hypothetical protein